MLRKITVILSSCPLLQVALFLGVITMSQNGPDRPVHAAINVKPEGWGVAWCQATHRNLIVRPVPWEGILIVHDVPSVGKFEAT